MKTILSKLSGEQARLEIKKFTWVSLPFAVVGFFIFHFLGVFALLFGSRAFTLTFHKDVKTLPKLWMYRILSVVLSLLGWFEATVALGSISK